MNIKQLCVAGNKNLQLQSISLFFKLEHLQYSLRSLLLVSFTFTHYFANVRTFFLIKAVTVRLLASAPLAAAFGVSDVVDFEKRHVVSTPNDDWSSSVISSQ